MTSRRDASPGSASEPDVTDDGAPVATPCGSKSELLHSLLSSRIAPSPLTPPPPPLTSRASTGSNSAVSSRAATPTASPSPDARHVSEHLPVDVASLSPRGSQAADGRSEMRKRGSQAADGRSERRKLESLMRRRKVESLMEASRPESPVSPQAGQTVSSPLPPAPLAHATRHATASTLLPATGFQRASGAAATSTTHSLPSANIHNKLSYKLFKKEGQSPAAVPSPGGGVCGGVKEEPLERAVRPNPFLTDGMSRYLLGARQALPRPPLPLLGLTPYTLPPSSTEIFLASQQLLRKSFFDRQGIHDPLAQLQMSGRPAFTGLVRPAVRTNAQAAATATAAQQEATSIGSGSKHLPHSQPSKDRHTATTRAAREGTSRSKR